MKCPNCGNETQPDAVFCDQCGAKLETAPAPHKPVSEPEAAPAASQQTPVVAASVPAPQAESAPPVASEGIICPNCHASNTPGEMFCSECGAPLGAPQPEAAAEGQDLAAGQPAVQPPTAARAEATKCPVCGADIAANDTFCYACGAELGAPAEVDVTPVGSAVEQESPAPVPLAPADQAVAGALDECPACGAKVKPGDSFCEFCGAALIAPHVPAAVVAPPPAAARLVIADSGIEIPLPASAETLVGRDDPFGNVYPDIDLTPHKGEQGGVSRRHFRIVRTGQQYAIEDLNSTNFTVVNRTRLEPGKPVVLQDEDEIRAGRVKLIFKVD